MLLRSSQVDETIIMPILICVSSYEEEVIKLQKDLEARQLGRSKDIMLQESKLRQYLECLAQNVVWISHSVYDRNCNTKVVKANESVTHYMWNKNLITMKQVGTQVEVIVRNAAYNYRTVIDTKNVLQQTSIGSYNQISKIRNAMMRQAKGRPLEDQTSFN